MSWVKTVHLSPRLIQTETPFNGFAIVRRFHALRLFESLTAPQMTEVHRGHSLNLRRDLFRDRRKNLRRSQLRSYLFLPTSWTELQLSMYEVQEPSIVHVKLRRRDNITALESEVSTWDSQERQTSRSERVNNVSTTRRNLRHVRSLKHAIYTCKIVRPSRQTNGNRRLRSMSSPPQRLTMRLQSTHRGKQFVPMLRYVKRKSQATKQDYHTTTRKFDDSVYNFSTVPVELHEYSKKSWFDAAGRPIASRDETGRFVNPWMSQSTNGVRTFGTLLQWRITRLQREWNQYGLGLFLPTFLRNSSATVAAPSSQPSLTIDESLLSRTRKKPGPLKNATDPSFLRCTLIGHSTCLVQKGSVRILTDPIFSNRASPWQKTHIGVARDVPPAYSIADLPDFIDVCLISHDHYDHLDKDSVLQLQDRVGMWVVPLGIGRWLREKSEIPPERILELSWWDSVLLRRTKKSSTESVYWTIAERHSLVSNEVSPYFQGQQHQQSHSPPHPAIENPANRDQIWITACPAQHWSVRTFFDRCYRLWASFAVFLDHNQTFFFAGDTGLPRDFPLFEQIADYIGRPVDLAALPIGAYAPRFVNSHEHIDPYEAVQIHQILQCRRSVAIHHGSFPLGEEPPEEPSELLRKAALEANIANFDVVPNGGSVAVKAQPQRRQ